MGSHRSLHHIFGVRNLESRTKHTSGSVWLKGLKRKRRQEQRRSRKRTPLCIGLSSAEIKSLLADKKISEEQIKSFGLKGKVTVSGEIPHTLMFSILKELDVFVFSSRYEGTPNALLEAMAAERAVVSTRFEGSLEVITDGKNGLLVDVESPSSLAKGIVRVLGDVDLRNRLGKAARETILSKHTIEQESALWEHVYREALRLHRLSIH